MSWAECCYTAPGQVHFYKTGMSFCANYDLLDYMIANGEASYDDWFLQDYKTDVSEEIRNLGKYMFQISAHKDRESCLRHGGHFLEARIGTGIQKCLQWQFLINYIILLEFK